MKKIFLLLAVCAMPVLASNATVSAAKAESDSLVTTNEMKVQAGQDISAVAREQKIASSAVIPDGLAMTTNFNPPRQPEVTESPTCLYGSARYSEGAIVLVGGSSLDKYIECGNKKDSKDRTIAIWKQVK